jgi:hypothetical protein
VKENFDKISKLNKTEMTGLKEDFTVSFIFYFAMFYQKLHTVHVQNLFDYNFRNVPFSV